MPLAAAPPRQTSCLGHPAYLTKKTPGAPLRYAPGTRRGAGAYLPAVQGLAGNRTSVDPEGISPARRPRQTTAPPLQFQCQHA